MLKTKLSVEHKIWLSVIVSTSSKRVTRSSKKKEYTCYDEYLCDSKGRKGMCHRCVTYLDDPEKKKKQHERGLRYACQKPKALGVVLPSNSDPVLIKRKQQH